VKLDKSLVINLSNCGNDVEAAVICGSAPFRVVHDSKNH